VGQLPGSQVGCGVSHAWLDGSHCWNPSWGQFVHAVPAVPHCASWLPGWQLPAPSQHPLGQVAALQVGATVVQVCVCGLQVLLAAQLAQAVPLAPQAAVDVPDWQTPFESQHPVGQLPGPHFAPSIVGMIPLSSGRP
jgi:hypothetical protein